MNPFRRRLLGSAAAALAWPVAAQVRRPLVEVWKDVSCGCCHDWIAHMKANGFDVRAYDVGNTAARQRLGVPARLGACHTALVDGYAVEGHVPAREIQRLLRERPKVIGLVVPGMPIGSPGMEMEGKPADEYEVVTFDEAGETTVFAWH